MTTQFIRGLADYRPSNGDRRIVTMGTFDGIHLGHQEILRRVKQAQADLGLQAVLITFHPHPRVVVSPNDIPMLLTSIEEKEQFIPHFFDGEVLVLEFNEEMRNTSANQFIEKVLIERLRVSKLIVGYDHAFGRNREGSIPALRSLGAENDFEVEVVEPVLHGGRAVSSSLIRRLMTEGDYAEAVELLGHDYAIYGTVGKGIGLGRKLGYPTANVQYSPRKLLPPEGVYACWAQLENEEKSGMMFVGQNYFNPVPTVSVEANLFDFNGDIYGKEIVLYPTHYIRPNCRFASADALTRQIRNDKKDVLRRIESGERQCQ